MTVSHVWRDLFICDVSYSHVWRDSFICATWLILRVFTLIPQLRWHDSFTYVTWLTHMWRELFTCVTWLIHMCDMTHPLYLHPNPSTKVTWLIHMCDVTHSYVTWIIHMCDVNHSCVTWLILCVFTLIPQLRWNDSCICVTWLIHMCDRTHSHVWRDSFIRVCDVTHSYVCCDAFICVMQFIHLRAVSQICVTMCCSVLQCVAVCCSVLQCVAVCCSVLHCHMTHPSRGDRPPSHKFFDQDPLPLPHAENVTHSYVWTDSFIRETWLIHVRHDSFIYEWVMSRNSSSWHASFIRVTWLLHMCDMTHPPRLHPTPSTKVTWLIQLCDVTHSYVTWLIHMCDAIFRASTLHPHSTFFPLSCFLFRKFLPPLPSSKPCVTFICVTLLYT